MFTDSIFRMALIFSLLVHVSVIVPMALFSSNKAARPLKIVELNYIIIEKPLLAEEAENYTEKLKGRDVLKDTQKETVSHQKEASIFTSLEEPITYKLQEESQTLEKPHEKDKHLENKAALLKVNRHVIESAKAVISKGM